MCLDVARQVKDDGQHQNPSPIWGFDVARHLCHSKGDGQRFRETSKGSKVTCIIFACHSCNSGDGDAQQQCTKVTRHLRAFFT